MISGSSISDDAQRPATGTAGFIGYFHAPDRFAAACGCATRLSCRCGHVDIEHALQSLGPGHGRAPLSPGALENSRFAYWDGHQGAGSLVLLLMTHYTLNAVTVSRWRRGQYAVE